MWGWIVYNIILWDGIYEYSLNLSGNQKMEREIKIEFGFIINNDKDSIKVYH